MKTRNKQFVILECLAIIFVVLGHKPGACLMNEWFPLYSFHIPLFFFISGYFYNKNYEATPFKFLSNKIKKFIIPAIIINIIYGLIVTSLISLGVVAYANINFSLTNIFITPWFHGHQFALNISMWFIFSLFLIQVFYFFLRKILSYNDFFYNEWILLIICAVFSYIGVFFAYSGYRNEWWLTLVKVLYGSFFYHLGFLYNQKLEEKDNVNNFIYFFVIFISQIILIKFTDNQLTSTVWNAEFNGLKSCPIIALITPLTGIFFWLRVSRIFVPSLGNSFIINFIGNHTWTVMNHHQFVFFLINAIYYLIHVYTTHCSYFNINEFMTNPWYGYYVFNIPQGLMVYSFMGVVVPLSIKYLLINRIHVNNSFPVLLGEKSIVQYIVRYF